VAACAKNPPIQPRFCAALIYVRFQTHQQWIHHAPPDQLMRLLRFCVYCLIGSSSTAAKADSPGFSAFASSLPSLYPDSARSAGEGDFSAPPPSSVNLALIYPHPFHLLLLSSREKCQMQARLFTLTIVPAPALCWLCDSTPEPKLLAGRHTGWKLNLCCCRPGLGIRVRFSSPTSLSCPPPSP